MIADGVAAEEGRTETPLATCRRPSRRGALRIPRSRPHGLTVIEVERAADYSCRSAPDWEGRTRDDEGAARLRSNSSLPARTRCYGRSIAVGAVSSGRRPRSLAMPLESLRAKSMEDGQHSANDHQRLAGAGSGEGLAVHSTMLTGVAAGR